MSNYVKLGSVCELDADNLTEQTSQEYEFDYISLSDIDKGRLLNCTRLKFADAPSRARRKVKKNDVLLSTVRPNLQGFYIFRGQVENVIVSTGFCVLTPQKGLHPEYLHQYLYSYAMSKTFHAYNVGTNYPAINSSDIQNFRIYLPPLDEQKAIADALQTWDTAIQKTEALITAKEQQFNWLLSKIINKNTRKRVQLSHFISEISTRNTNNNVYRVLSVTNKKGFALSEDQFQRRIASSDISNYKIVKRREYAYNPSRINVGSIARLNEWSEGLLSPMYIVFKLDEDKIDSDYFLHWLSSYEARQRIIKSAQGSVRESVGFSDLGTIPISLPDTAEQKKKSEILNTAKQEIKTLTALVKLYNQQKCGMTNKLLSGTWRI